MWMQIMQGFTQHVNSEAYSEPEFHYKALITIKLVDDT